MLKTLKKCTILRVYFKSIILCCLIFTIVDWKALTFEEGWEIIYMVGLVSIGLVGLLADFILHSIIKNKKILNVLGVLIAIGFTIMLLTELK